jgi:hypothetical protein
VTTEQLIAAIQTGVKSGIEKIQAGQPALNLTDEEMHYLASDICYHVENAIEDEE